MCLCTLCADRFLRGLYPSRVFRAYCRTRQISLPRQRAERPWDETVRWWTETVGSLPDEHRARIEWEQLAVSELGTPEGCDHLLTAAAGGALPPRSVPSGAPIALWFLLHHADLFRAVYLRHERRPADVWYAGRAAPGLPLPDTEVVEGRLAASLGAHFRASLGTGTACAVRGHRIPGAVYFAVRLGARPSVLEALSPSGTPIRRSVPQTVNADVVYYPRDGTVLLRSPLRSADRVQEFWQCVSRAVLHAPLKSEQSGFALDRLKQPFQPLPDDEDIEEVRVKTLHLQYPGRVGRRELTLNTLTSDTPSAIEEMLRAHAGGVLDDLQVSHAVLQVRLRLEGCSKTHLVRLWPDRCDAGQGPLRTRVLACLRTWGL